MTDHDDILRDKLDETLRRAAPRLYSADRRLIVNAVLETILDNATEVTLAANARGRGRRTADASVFEMTPPTKRHLRAVPDTGGMK